MKRAVLLFLLLLSPLSAAYGVFSGYSSEMEPIVETISTLPEAKALLQRVEREGKVSVKGSSRFGSQFSAYWDGGRREISVPNANKRRKGDLIRSVVYELHNAKRNKEIADLDRRAMRGQISKKSYVEALERIEHRNALEACALLEKGVRAGVFPADARWYMPEDFNDYFRAQKRSGHSGWIAHKYEGMRPLART